MSWWKRYPIYQIYPRSFKDANGDGVGDIKGSKTGTFFQMSLNKDVYLVLFSGILQKIDYFEWLGIKTIWISPIYKSPMADFGYDISDYRDIDPIFGTMDDFKELVQAAHKKGTPEQVIEYGKVVGPGPDLWGL